MNREEHSHLIVNGVRIEPGVIVRVTTNSSRIDEGRTDQLAELKCGRSGRTCSIRTARRSLRRGQFVDVDHSLGKGLRSLLRQVVADATGDEAVLILARELIAIRRAGRVN